MNLKDAQIFILDEKETCFENLSAKTGLGT